MTVLSRFLGKAMKLPAAESHAVKVDRDLAIPMPDGTVLLADRFIPAGGSDSPLVLVRSPYGRKNMFGTLFGTMFAERGLQVLVQSCRGTFGSGGEFDPFAETDDGLATVAWLRAQKWYPGSFATCGPSYLGMVQWAIAAQAGPDLKAMALLVTTSDPHATFYDGGSYTLETSLVWLNLVAHQERRFALIRQARDDRRLRPLFGQLPLGGLDVAAIGRQSSMWQDWLTHTDADDPFWSSRRWSSASSSLAVPVSFVGGWYDIFLPGQLRDYAALRAAGHEPYLLIGPWQHTDQDGMATSVRESVAFLRAQLLDDAPLRQARVRVHVGGLEGDGAWRDLPAWPPPATEQRWHLQAGGALSADPPGASAPDGFTYDPVDPTPSVGGPVLSASVGRGSAPPDNRQLEARADVLTYTSASLPADLEVMGQVSADLFVRSSLENTDFFARLCDVDPAGRSVGVCDAIIRLTPGKVAPEADGTIRVLIELWPTAYAFRAGHRVRLQVSSGAHPRYARNPGSGEPLATAAKLVKADQQVYHDPDHPSALVLPVTPTGANAG
jgi:putative CocE/NonD family hydrolase